MARRTPAPFASPLDTGEERQLWDALNIALDLDGRDEVIAAVSRLTFDKETLEAVPELEDVRDAYNALNREDSLEDLLYELEKRGFTIARLR